MRRSVEHRGQSVANPTGPPHTRHQTENNHRGAIRECKLANHNHGRRISTEANGLPTQSVPVDHARQKDREPIVFSSTCTR